MENGGHRFLDIPNESFAKKHSIHVWRGPYYVRITGGGPGDTLLRLARFVADRMPPAPGKPAVFAFLPDAQRISGSERYSADSVFGQPYLGNSFQVTYNIDGDMIEGIVIPAASSPAAANILDQYKGLYLHNGKLLDPIPNLGEDNFTAEDRYLGRVVAFRIIASSWPSTAIASANISVATTDQRSGMIRCNCHGGCNPRTPTTAARQRNRR
jgi:hypothetical protein